MSPSSRKYAAKKIVRLPLLLLVALASGVVWGQTLPSAAEPASVAVSATPPANAPGYAGSENCRSCHRAEHLEFGKTAHAHLKSASGDSVTGCEVCHGPGKAHADAEQAAHGDEAATKAANQLIFAFRGKAKDNWSRCLQCHRSSHDQREFERSAHARHGVGCNECHVTHLVEAARDPNRTKMQGAQALFFSAPSLGEETRWLHSSLLKENQPTLCGRCHGNIVGQFALPTHHPVPEGAMKCTDCHDTHGTGNRAMLRLSGWETCVKCHVEKRGPFVFEHSAVKVEGCVICHTPHGSVNKLLLVRREERFLCLSCHVDPSAANVPHGRLSFQTRGDCTRCHSNIHGSNFDPNFLH